MTQLIDSRDRVLMYQSPSQLVRDVVDIQKRQGKFNLLGDSGFTGRRFSSWDDLAFQFSQPWKEGLEVVNRMRGDLADADLGVPRDMRRRLKLNEDEGELDTQRFLDGEDDCYREARRQVTHGVRTISLICQLGASWRVDYKDLFWQGAAAIAAVDLLERAGYSVEVSMYSLTLRTYRHSSQGSNAFVWCKLKDAGDEVNTDTLVNSLSGWFFRNVVIGSFYMMGKPRKGHGRPTKASSWYSKYMDIDTNCLSYHMPVVSSYEEAVNQIRGMLSTIEESV